MEQRRRGVFNGSHDGARLTGGTIGSLRQNSRPRQPDRQAGTRGTAERDGPRAGFFFLLVAPPVELATRASEPSLVHLEREREDRTQRCVSVRGGRKGGGKSRKGDEKSGGKEEEEEEGRFSALLLARFSSEEVFP